MPKKRAIIVGALGLVGAVIYNVATYGDEKTDAATLESHVAPIASKISGYVTAIKVRDNQRVQAGDVLVEIEETDYKAAVQQAQAGVLAAQARLVAAGHNIDSTRISAPSSLESAKSQVAAASAEWDRARKELTRLHHMNESARSKQSLDNAIAAEKSAKSMLLDAQARLKTAQTAPNTIAAAEAGVMELQAALARAKADMVLAQRNMDAAKIRAPFTGRVAKRMVEQGAYIQPAQQLMTVVSDEVWVQANYKETQLKKMRIGQPAVVHVDAYPDLKLTGKVDSIQAGTGARFSLFPPENATGNFVKIVQRVPVKITLDNVPQSGYVLGAGMSVEPVVDTSVDVQVHAPVSPVKP